MVVLAPDPAPVMADCAALADWPTTPGTVTQLPLEITRLTGVFGGTVVPPGGSAPPRPRRWNWLEHALVWLPTLRPAWVKM